MLYMLIKRVNRKELKWHVVFEHNSPYNENTHKIK